MRIFENLNIDFLSKRKIAYVVSGTLIFLGLISLIFRGLELGIDFVGGAEVAVQFEKPVEIGTIRDYLSNVGLGNVEVKTFGGDEGILVRTELQEIPTEIFPTVLATVTKTLDDKMPGINYRQVETTINSVTFQFDSSKYISAVSKMMRDNGFQASIASPEPENTQLVVRVSIADWIETLLRENISDNPFVVLREVKVGPKIGNELKVDAIIAIALSLLGILIYLGFRFKFVFALGAVAALFHDVIITLGVFSLLHGFIPVLNLEISIIIVAAFLTLVGYSINDTVVVFDRVREFLKIHKTAPLEENINKGINRTMSRTVITSGTTLLVVTILLFFGGEVLRGFAFTLFFGIIVGTYSSIFVASPFVLEYAKRTSKKISF
jgi:preprotein translocase SecF subunit